MTQIDTRYLDPVLTPQHADLIDNPKERTRLLDQIEINESGAIGDSLMSRTGRVLGRQLATGQRLIYESDIETDFDARLKMAWHSVGEPTIYQVTTDDDEELADDIRRLFLSHSLRTGGATLFAGWRQTVVALVPDEGASEWKIFRSHPIDTIPIHWTRAVTVLDAYGTYAQWVNDLAMSAGYSHGDTRLGIIIQAWLLREAADAQLEQARHALKLGLARHARRLKKKDPSTLSIAELARSLYTDRANLSRVIRAAEIDPEVAAVGSGDIQQMLARMVE